MTMVEEDVLPAFPRVIGGGGGTPLTVEVAARPAVEDAVVVSFGMHRGTVRTTASRSAGAGGGPATEEEGKDVRRASSSCGAVPGSARARHSSRAVANL